MKRILKSFRHKQQQQQPGLVVGASELTGGKRASLVAPGDDPYDDDGDDFDDDDHANDHIVDDSVYNVDQDDSDVDLPVPQQRQHRLYNNTTNDGMSNHDDEEMTIDDTDTLYTTATSSSKRSHHHQQTRGYTKATTTTPATTTSAYDEMESYYHTTTPTTTNSKSNSQPQPSMAVGLRWFQKVPTTNRRVVSTTTVRIPPPPPPPPQAQLPQASTNNHHHTSTNDTPTTVPPSRCDETRNLVKKFIADIWNRGALDLIPQVCSPSLRFNGNTGFDRVGHDGLARMVATIRDALDEYHCEIHSMVVEDNKAFCRLRFTGKHVGPLLGYPPTNKIVAWMGATEFTCQNGKILKVWELGDVKSLEEQLTPIEN